MKKQHRGWPLNALRGKTVHFQGKWGDELERVRALVEAQQGTIAPVVIKSLDYAVLADLSAGKTIQKEIASLNAKGAHIQVLDATGIAGLAEPSSDQILQLIRERNDIDLFSKAVGSIHTRYANLPLSARYTFRGENFDGLDLSDFDFTTIEFEQCSFVGATLSNTSFRSTRRCDFSLAAGESTFFGDVEDSRFSDSALDSARFDGDIAGADFGSARLECLHVFYQCTARGRRCRRKQPARTSAELAPMRSNL